MICWPRLRWAVAAACLLGGVGMAPSRAADDPPSSVGALSPQDSLQQIVVEPGLRVELVAHEPHVVDPVAIRFDERGRMWVVQMSDYPTGPVEGKPGRSRISVLEDRDGDGFYETAAVFADGLDFATGVQPWKGGAYVTLAGELAYMRDEDGDGRADKVATIYAGFAQQNTQLRANDPRLALDNRVYVAGGLRGGEIIDVRDSRAKPVSISGMDFCFDPRTYAYEAAAGACQFGMTFDDFGNRFICTNRNPAIHVVMDNRDLAKNPLTAIPAVTHDVARPAGESRLYPLGKAWTTSNLHAGQFTAACGVTVYRGDALPPAYYGNVFTCDPTGRLVHREIMAPDGVTFTATPAREGAEFFASRDPWCAPVNLEVGPDGALYVVDMYRAVIEHPEWMPEELKPRPDLNDGADRGRIYRIVADGGKLNGAGGFENLASWSTEQLAASLANANAWRRETCARLLLEREDPAALPLLHRLALDGDSAPARVHALWLLRGLQGDRRALQEILSALLQDADPRVVEQAILVADRAGLAQDASLAPLIENRFHHAEARVRFRAALALAPRSVPLAQPADRWMQFALLIAAGDRGGTALEIVLSDAESLRRNMSKPRWFVVQLAQLAAASSDAAERRKALSSLLNSAEYVLAGLAPFLEGAAAHGHSLAVLSSGLDARDRERLDALLKRAHRDAADPSATDAQREAAIELAALLPDAAQVLAAAAQVGGERPRIAALRELGRTSVADPWPELLAAFPDHGPPWQGALLDALLARPERTVMLLDEVAAGRIAPAELGVQRVSQLSQHRSPAIRSRAEQVLAEAAPADRRQVLQDYQVALSMKGDARRGREVFKKHCAACHRIGDVGVAFAPDVSDSREKTPAQILTDVLQPNRAVDANYFNYAVLTVDGLSHNGILATETASSITLKQAEGKQLTIRRDEIDELSSTGRSLMPEGLEKEIPHQAMADLIAFIKNWRYLDGSVPLPVK